MARPNLNEEERLVSAATRISPKAMAQVEEVSAQYEWSIAQTLRKLIERGLEVGLIVGLRRGAEKYPEIDTPDLQPQANQQPSTQETLI